MQFYYKDNACFEQVFGRQNNSRCKQFMEFPNNVYAAQMIICNKTGATSAAMILLTFSFSLLFEWNIHL